MKSNRIMGVILSVIVVLLAVGYYKSNNKTVDNPFELIGDSGYMAVNNVHYNDTKLTNEDNRKEELIEYTNTNSYPVTINSDSVSVTCSGITVEDEVIAKNNYRIKATFSREKRGLQENKLVVKPNEKIYIHVISSYESNNYPVNEVTCNYNLSILTA